MSENSFTNADVESNGTDSENSDVNEPKNREPSLLKRLRSRSTRLTKRKSIDSMSDNSFANADIESTGTDSENSDVNEQKNSEPGLRKRLRSRSTRLSKRKSIDTLPREPYDSYGTDSTEEYWDESQAKRIGTMRTRSSKKNHGNISKSSLEEVRLCANQINF
jgi:hypothetical protein